MEKEMKQEKEMKEKKEACVLDEIIGGQVPPLPKNTCPICGETYFGSTHKCTRRDA